MAARVFSVEFRSAVAQRILNGASVMALSDEFKIKRSVLYRWRDAYLKSARTGSRRQGAGRQAAVRLRWRSLV